MKKILVLMLMVFVSLSSVALAAKKPIKIARIPIIIQNIQMDNKTALALEVKMSRAVIIPMNETLKIAEFIPPLEAQADFDATWNKMYTKNKHAEMSDAVKKFAKEFDADLVICPILRHYSQKTVPINGNLETHLKSAVSAELIIYDKTKNELIQKKARRNFNNIYNKYGEASYLAGECFDQLINDTGLRKLVFSKRG